MLFECVSFFCGFKVTLLALRNYTVCGVQQAMWCSKCMKVNYADKLFARAVQFQIGIDDADRKCNSWSYVSNEHVINLYAKQNDWFTTYLCVCSFTWARKVIDVDTDHWSHLVTWDDFLLRRIHTCKFIWSNHARSLISSTQLRFHNFYMHVDCWCKSRKTQIDSFCLVGPFVRYSIEWIEYAWLWKWHSKWQKFTNYVNQQCDRMRKESN